jgi:hypothetical protein
MTAPCPRLIRPVPLSERATIPGIAALGSPHTDDRGDDHDGLCDDDRGRDKSRTVGVTIADRRQTIERNDRRIAEMKGGKRKRKNQKRLMLDQNVKPARLAFRIFFLAARCAIIDGVA